MPGNMKISDVQVTVPSKIYVKQKIFVKFKIESTFAGFEFPFETDKSIFKAEFVKDYIMGAVKEAFVIIDGAKVKATLNPSSGYYEAAVNAPNKTSYPLKDHVFPITLEATDMAGNKTTMDNTDKTYGSKLKIRVLENTQPLVSIKSPTEGSVLGSTSVLVDVTASDDNGSGINIDMSYVSINGTKTTFKTINSTSGSTFTINKNFDFTDGANKLEVTVQDNDGNTTTKNVNFVVSSKAPTLNVTSPSDGIITNSTSVTVSGTTTPGSSSVTVAEVTINGVRVDVRDGAFSKEVNLTEGENTLTIVSKDSLGKTTTVTRRITVDTKSPVITDVIVEESTVHVGELIHVKFKVLDM